MLLQVIEKNNKKSSSQIQIFIQDFYKKQLFTSIKMTNL